MLLNSGGTSALVYFCLNSTLISLAISFEKGLPAFQIWREHFLWLSLNYFGGASLAAFFVLYSSEIDFRYLAIMIPLLVVLYFAFKTTVGRTEDSNLHLVQLNKLYLSTIETLAMAIDAKDQITHGHVRRVQLYAGGLARALGMKDQGEIRAVEAAALLHDMGKLAVPEYILNKPGQLTAAEFEKMKLHATVGADILASIDFPYPVVPIVRHHHERWDGAGYPAGLKETEIPIGARILSVVDCFDALTSDRPYRPKLSHTEALRILKERSGIMYDAAIVETFSKIYGTLAPTDSELGRESEKRGRFSAITASAQPSLTEATTASRLDDISASTDEMLTVYNLARALTGQTNLADAGDVIAKHLRRMLPTSLSVFYVYDEQRDELVAEHASGEHAELVNGLRIPLGQRLTGWVGANRQTILNSDPVLDLGDMARSLNPRPRSCLSTPLVADKELVGVLSLYSTSRDAFSEDHRRIIEVVARQVSQVVRHAAEFDTVRQTTLKDPLTGLPNIEHLKQFFSSATSEDQRLEEPLSLLFVDVDGLTLINDEFGRATGDQTLSKIVEATRLSLRGADILFRYANDEFVVVLDKTDGLTAQSIADRVRATVTTQHTVGGKTIHPSVRVGAATFPEDGQSLTELIDAARTRLRTARGTEPHRLADPSSSVH